MYYLNLELKETDPLIEKVKDKVGDPLAYNLMVRHEPVKLKNLAKKKAKCTIAIKNILTKDKMVQVQKSSVEIVKKRRPISIADC